MKLSPHELTQKQFILLDKLDHRELVPFIRLYINKRTKYAVFYYFINILFIILAAYFFMAEKHLPGYLFMDRLSHFSYGIALSFALLPLHEYIHVLAYKSQGAVNTSYSANLKKFYFMALADKFVANKKEFTVVALAPFVSISLIFTLLLFAVPAQWMLTVTATLLMHTAMCSGDFGLLSYFEFHKDKEVVTYDDIENKVSYFYGRAYV